MTQRTVPAVRKLVTWSGVLATFFLAVPAYAWSVDSGSYCAFMSRDLSFTIVWTGIAMAATVLPVGVGFMLAGRQPPRWLAWPFAAMSVATSVVGVGQVAGDRECLHHLGILSYHLGVYVLVGALGLLGLVVAILRPKAAP
jgi:hypothetical protein